MRLFIILDCSWVSESNSYFQKKYSLIFRNCCHNNGNLTWKWRKCILLSECSLDVKSVHWKCCIKDSSFFLFSWLHVINAVAFTNRYSVDIFMVLGPDQSPQVSCGVLMKCCANCWDKSNRSCLLSPFFCYRPVCPGGILSINIKAKLTLI